MNVLFSKILTADNGDTGDRVQMYFISRFLTASVLSASVFADSVYNSTEFLDNGSSTCFVDNGRIPVGNK